MSIKIRKTTTPMLAGLLLVSSCISFAGTLPADSYFSLAVSDNSHNHYGENLLFLDFSTDVQACHPHPRTICATATTTPIQLDGVATEWAPATLTVVNSRVMNNYPLGEHYDATPTTIEVGARYDAENIYLLVRYEDANRDASTNRNRWVFEGGNWQPMPHVAPNPLTAAATATNRNETLAGGEDEDQIFMMFPIVDQQQNFRDGSHGCAGYCHANLTLTAAPDEAQIGDGVASMHTAIPDDMADLWHWTATRTSPMQTLKDGFLDYGEQGYNGRKDDAGTHPFEDNALTQPFRPRYVNRDDYEAGRYNTPGFATTAITPESALAIDDSMQFAAGVSLPFYVHRPDSGSLADVKTAANFDADTGRWTVEFKRKLQTGDQHDHQFVAGIDALPPTLPMVTAGNPERGAQLFRDKACADCHGDKGEGVYNNGNWDYPRNQRVSGPAILKTVSLSRPERLYAIMHELKKVDEAPPTAMMPYVPLTPQQAEDIASWLQQQYLPIGR